MSHFLFIAGALRERNSLDSAELQLGAGIWGLCTALIRDNLQKFLTPDSHGLVYVLKEGIRAEFSIVSPLQPFQALDELLKDEVRTEARYGFVRVRPVRRWQAHAPECQALLQQVLGIEEQSELSRRLALGMHRLTDAEYQTIVERLGPGQLSPIDTCMLRLLEGTSGHEMVGLFDRTDFFDIDVEFPCKPG